jgi:hypothetical protein
MKRLQPEKQKQTGFTGAALAIFPNPTRHQTNKQNKNSSSPQKNKEK